MCKRKILKGKIENSSKCFRMSVREIEGNMIYMYGNSESNMR